MTDKPVMEPTTAALRNAVLEAITRSDDYHVLDGVLGDALASARAAAAAPVLEALRHYGKHVEWPRCASLRNAANPCDCGLSTTLSAPPLRPSGEPEPGGLDVGRIYRALWESDAIWQFGNPKRATAEDRFRRMAEAIVKADAARLTPERPAG